MKFLIIILMSISNLSIASTEQDYNNAIKQFIILKEIKTLKLVSVKLNINYDTIHSSLSREWSKLILSRNGYLKSDIGICEVKIKLGILNNGGVATCVTSDHHIKKIFL